MKMHYLVLSISVPVGYILCTDPMPGFMLCMFFLVTGLMLLSDKGNNYAPHRK